MHQSITNDFRSKQTVDIDASISDVFDDEYNEIMMQELEVKKGFAVSILSTTLYFNHGGKFGVFQHYQLVLE